MRQAAAARQRGIILLRQGRMLRQVHPEIIMRLHLVMAPLPAGRVRSRQAMVRKLRGKDQLLWGLGLSQAVRVRLLRALVGHKVEQNIPLKLKVSIQWL